MYLELGIALISDNFQSFFNKEFIQEIQGKLLRIRDPLMFNKQSIWSKYYKNEEINLELGISWIFVELSLDFNKGFVKRNP